MFELQEFQDGRWFVIAAHESVAHLAKFWRMENRGFTSRIVRQEAK